MGDLLTMKEAVTISGYTSVTIRRWIKQGVLDVIVLPHTRIPQYRVRRESLDRVLRDRGEETRRIL